MNENVRIGLEDTVMTAIVKMAEGNPGAVTVLVELIKHPEIDPDDFMESLGSLIALDSLGIYGSNIWVLFKNVCGQDLVKLVTVLRANQLGFLSEKDLKDSLNYEKWNSLNHEELFKKVKERLPRFGTIKT